MKIVCAHCGRKTDKPSGAVNRARAAGLKIYCGRRCSGLGRRLGKTKAELIEAKRLYDLEYRANNHAMLKSKKRNYHKRTYDPAKARIERKKRAKAHVEYCRRPEYRAWKREYDRQYRANEFGPFAESYLLLLDVNREIKQRMTNYEIKWQNGTFGKAQKRRREGGEERTRDRNRAA